jgi:hypothetical protein
MPGSNLYPPLPPKLFSYNEKINKPELNKLNKN